jgi:hypothetical protein
VCGVCGFALDEIGKRPRCTLVDEEIAGGIRARQEERAALLREVEETLSQPASTPSQG